jgi:hypothetical protein
MVDEYFDDKEFMDILADANEAANTDADLAALDAIETRWMFGGSDEISDEEIRLLERLAPGPEGN